MSRVNTLLQKFNRGQVSPLAMARVDLDSAPFVCEEMTNWMPRVLGSMMMRPGTEYIGGTNLSNKAKHIPFVFSLSDTAIIELTDNIMRVRVDEDIITRPSVSTTITNGTFTSDITSWNDDSAAGCTAAWATGGYASLT